MKELSFFNNIEKSLSENRFKFEAKAYDMGFKAVAGVDEVGRGALAGPVVACALILPKDKNKIPKEINDSKKLSKKMRVSLFKEIVDCSISIGIGIVDNREIDRTSILRASLKAMELATASLKPAPSIVLVDGNQKFLSNIPQKTIKKGDEKSYTIGAASIIAKVIRDNIMENYHLLHPLYGFIENKGYGTKYHLGAIKKNGACSIHRTTYRGVGKPRK